MHVEDMDAAIAAQMEEEETLDLEFVSLKALEA